MEAIMDDQTRVLLRGVFRFLDQQQQMLTQALVVSMALRKAMKELNPQFEAIYAKHYQAEMQSPGKKEADGFREVLAGLIRQLDSGGGSEN
jgi:hypothetical protein